MSKSSKPKKKQKASINANINIGGDVSGSNIIVGHDNIINIEALKTTYGLFTIPQPVTDFTGREAELAGLKASFANGAIITGLSGAGGIGKTELARKLAYDIAENFPDAQMNIDLLGTSEKPTSPEDAMRRLLEPFHVEEKLPDDEAQLKNLYQHTFGKKRVLLLLDNAANAAQVRPLIPPAPSAAIITSRQHFSLTEFGLHEPMRLDVLSSEKAREFLLGASPKIADSLDEEVKELAKLCGYLPLALRVAASLLNDRSDWAINTLINRLQNERTRLKRLKRYDDEDLNIEATLGLSYDLLTLEAQKGFRYLSVFTGSFWRFSAAAVWDMEIEYADDILGLLVNRNLLRSSPSWFFSKDDNEFLPFYTFHDLTRLYATEKLQENLVEAKDALARHARHFLHAANSADNEYQKGNEHILIALPFFYAIWTDLIAAWERFQVSANTDWPRPDIADQWLSDFGVQFINLLNIYFDKKHKRIPILAAALDAARRLNDKKSEVAHLGNLGSAYLDHNPAEAIRYLELANKISQSIGSQSNRGSFYNNLGLAHIYLGKPSESIQHFQYALSSFEEEGDLRGLESATGNLGNAYLALEDIDAAIKQFEDARQIAKSIGDWRGECYSLGNLGRATLIRGDWEKGIQYFNMAITAAQVLGDFQSEAMAQSALGMALLNLGKQNEGSRHIGNAIKIYTQMGNLERVAEIQELHAHLINKYQNESELQDNYTEVKKEETRTASIKDFIDEIVNAKRHKDPKAEQYFYKIAGMTIDENLAVEIRELVKVLQKILIGDKTPDLSRLPKELATLVKEALEK
jgi:tetratricopeptide (TPR) repeat protein